MANILTQSEIDELLSALASGKDAPLSEQAEDEHRSIRPYDFRVANKFSKDQMRTLHFIYDTFANRLSTYLSGNMRAICEVEVLSIEEQSFSELSNSMPTPVLIAVVGMSPLKGSILLEITPVVAYGIISRLLGGSGEMTENPDKAFTEIELSIMERVIRRMLLLMDESWERIIKVGSTLERIETSSQYVQIVSANEPIAIITLNVKIGEVSDIINLCIPHVTVQPIAKKLVMKTWYSDASPEKTPRDRTGFEEQISGVVLNLQAVFNTTTAKIRDLLNTKVGDVIQLEHNINKPVTAQVEHLPKFKGVVGIQDSNYAVRITEILKEEDKNEYRDILE
jgi:flagellar motor switch protein FliM